MPARFPEIMPEKILPSHIIELFQVKDATEGILHVADFFSILPPIFGSSSQNGVNIRLFIVSYKQK